MLIQSNKYFLIECPMPYIRSDFFCLMKDCSGKNMVQNENNSKKETGSNKLDNSIHDRHGLPNFLFQPDFLAQFSMFHYQFQYYLLAGTPKTSRLDPSFQ